MFIGFLVSCSLDGGDQPVHSEDQEKVKAKINLKGSGFSVNSSPLNARQGQQEVIAFRIEKSVGTEKERYARGVVRSMESLELEFDPNADYSLMLSYVNLDDQVDLGQRTSIFGRIFEQGVSEFIDYYPYELSNTLEIYPFHTPISAHFGDSYSSEKFPPSDKFVGEENFWIREEDTEVEIEMYRLSGSMGFRALNLTEGKVVVYVMEEDRWSGTSTAYSVELSPEQSEHEDLRPAIHIHNDYSGDLIDDIINGRGTGTRRPRRREGPSVTPLQTGFYIVVRHFEQEDGGGPYRDIITSEAVIYRNQSVVYQFDMEDYENSNSRILDGSKGLEAVAVEELEDGD